MPIKLGLIGKTNTGKTTFFNSATLSSEEISSIIRDCIEKKPKVIWLQEGIHDFESEELARKSGIIVVFNRCMLAEHRRLSL